jgi:hypothetical protein
MAIAVPVAKIAAEVLPHVLASLGEAKQVNGADPVVTGMVEWVPDDEDHVIYAINTTSKSIVINYQKQDELDGAYGIESAAIELPPRNSYDATEDIDVYADNGTMSASYASPAATDTDAVGALRQAYKYLPFLAAISFSAFGGSLKFERKRVVNGGTSSDSWEVSSNSKLSALIFKYADSKGQKIDFIANLSQETGEPGETDNAGDAARAFAYVYEIQLADGEATGLLKDFSVTIEAEKAEFAKLLSPRPLLPVEQLPERVRQRIASRLH